MVLKAIQENGDENIDSILETLLTYAEFFNPDSDDESKLLFLTKMGYSEAEAFNSHGDHVVDSSIAELTDFICAAQISNSYSC
ncbi:DNA (cytosine-5)-methyltransferase DRM2-like protein [Corchorus olitorius]|uniref:DNA (Cytosine-5)-methyltransferase DRM2-like protein n=1 Tax=Corchorus olitorius TaxID=93759 RepID=A0A1R3IDI9_9ROSI|nr:DNA (cytosine-5)-methyltransferase DRM2-like protein [Corchorus olitorius]